MVSFSPESGEYSPHLSTQPPLVEPRHRRACPHGRCLCPNPTSPPHRLRCRPLTAQNKISPQTGWGQEASAVRSRSSCWRTLTCSPGAAADPTCGCQPHACVGKSGCARRWRRFAPKDKRQRLRRFLFFCSICLYTFHLTSVAMPDVETAKVPLAQSN